MRDILLELISRGLCTQDTAKKIAIISEQDTIYGQVADDIVKRWVDEFQDAGLLNCDIEVKEFGYLRGVDGELPPRRESSGQPSNTSDDVASSETKLEAWFLPDMQREEPFGAAQLDYVRRLADTVSPMNTVGNRYAAIGIFGSDVYDKQLILQSLRERIPSATYFTTDLDARLADPDTYPWTRNLIVGSSYGFSVKGLDGASFRDSYQTALYRAVHLAIDVRDGMTRGAPSPRLFEIGRSGPIEITRCVDWWCGKPHPIHGQMFTGRGSNSTIKSRLLSLLVVLAPLISLTLISGVMAAKAKGTEFAVRFRTQAAMSTVGGVSGAGLAFVLWKWPLSPWEPWVPLEGVSSIPTLVLHLTTILFSAWIVTIAIDWMVEGHRKARSRFGLPITSDQKWRFGDDRSKIQISKWMKELMVKSETRPLKTPSKRIETVWAEYLTRCHWRARLVRIAVPVALSTFLVIVIIKNEPSPLLTKGFEAPMTWIRWLTILVVLATVFFCTDTLNLGRAIIRDLSMHDITGWNRKKYPESHSQLDPFISRRWQTMDLVVRCTQIVGGIVLLPFILLLLLMLSRTTLFEGWVWTETLVAIYLGFSLFVLARALQFQFEAVRARNAIVQHLNFYRHQVAGDPVQSERLEFVRDDIKNIQKGAFVPWTRHPILQSVALPSGGIGLITILNSLL